MQNDNTGFIKTELSTQVGSGVKTGGDLGKLVKRIKHHSQQN